MAAPGTVHVQITAALEAFRFNEAGLRDLISRRGPAATDLVRRAIRVENAAKSSMGQGAPPSAPGQPPAVRTGRLRASITWRLGEDTLGVYADVGTAVHYAPYLELGTSRMEARPFLRPALAAARG